MLDLAALQYNELERIDRDNKKNLGKLAHKMDHRTNKIDDLKTQRAFLINKVVLAQRLALARCHFSYKHSLHKAWGQWVRNSGVLTHQIIDGFTGENLKQMQGLKDRVSELEEANQQVAKENDRLRAGVNKSVKMVETAEEIHKELE